MNFEFTKFTLGKREAVLCCLFEVELEARMLQRQKIKIRDGMHFMTGQTFCVLKSKATGRLSFGVVFT